jgi:hypothetical protein
MMNANLTPMTKTYFTAYPVSDQRKLLLDHGAYLGHRRETPWSVLLYQIADFYVEVFFSVDSLHIHDIDAFEDLDRLDPYLERISLEGLLAHPR